MTSDHTEHHATRTGDGWKVTWLPGRMLDHNEATTAMTIAERIATGTSDWDPFISSWAAELGLSGPEAAQLVKKLTGNDAEAGHQYRLAQAQRMIDDFMKHGDGPG